MELPRYAVPASLLSPQPGPPSRETHTPSEPLNKFDEPVVHDKLRGKRKRTNGGSPSLKSNSGRVGLPQYSVPEALRPLPPADVTYQAPPNGIIEPNRHENHVAIPHPEHSIPVHRRSESVHFATGAHGEAQNHPHLPSSTNPKQSEELLRTMRPTNRPLDDRSDLAFQTAANSLGMKNDGFLGEWMAIDSRDVPSDGLGMSHDMFFPTPAMTEVWGDESTPNLSWNSAQELPNFLSDRTMARVEPGEAVDGAAPAGGRPQIVSEKRMPDTHNTIDMEIPLPKTDSQLEPSAVTGARLLHILKAVAAAGFDSLDDAVLAYYAETLKDDDRLRQQQRLSRIRRLPVLLKELNLAAQDWGPWQRRGFHEQIIKCTEDIIVAELQEHLSTGRSNKCKSNCSTEQRCQACKQMAMDDTDIEAELPNTWTLLTSLSSKFDAISSKNGQTDVPKLVRRFLATGTDSDV